MNTAQARRDINDVPVRGTHSHNIVSCTLRMLAKDEGDAAVNALVSALNLVDKFGIHEVWYCPCGLRLESYKSDGSGEEGLRWWCPPCNRKSLGV